jgi:hypothetical protein
MNKEVASSPKEKANWPEKAKILFRGLLSKFTSSPENRDNLLFKAEDQAVRKFLRCLDKEERPFRIKVIFKDGNQKSYEIEVIYNLTALVIL